MPVSLATPLVPENVFLRFGRGTCLMTCTSFTLVNYLHHGLQDFHAAATGVNSCTCDSHASLLAAIPKISTDLHIQTATRRILWSACTQSTSPYLQLLHLAPEVPLHSRLTTVPRTLTDTAKVENTHPTFSFRPQQHSTLLFGPSAWRTPSTALSVRAPSTVCP